MHRLQAKNYEAIARMREAKTLTALRKTRSTLSVALSHSITKGGYVGITYEKLISMRLSFILKRRNI